MAKCKRNRNKAKRNLTVKTPKATRNYKDTVFRMLFSDRKNLLSLYNAVNQRDYKNPEDLEIVTLENAIYMGMKNDLAFIVDKKSLFSSTLQKIPAPNFIEFYNGSTVIADCTELRLSSAFEHLSGEPKLELVVTVLNVNEGHNADLMQHCSMLKEYSQYVARVRHYASDMPLNEAVKHAVDECIREGILAEFLTRNRNEVISMSIFEYDKELEEKKLRKAEYEYGFSEGEKSGIAKGEKLGFHQAAIETAKRMLALQEFSAETIAAVSGLSLEEIKELQSSK